MPTEFKFPDVGEGITEGEIVEWKVKESDKVKEHQPILLIETDKAIVEIPSPASGIVLKIHHQAGDTVKVGEKLLTIGRVEEKIEVDKEHPYRKSVSVVGVMEEAPEIVTPPTKILATPATRRLAKQLEIDISQVIGTGLEGRITEDDVRNFAENEGKKVEIVKVAKRYDLYGYLEAIPMKGVRKSIAKKMVQSATKAVHVTTMDEADATELKKIREKEKIAAEKRGIHLTYIPFITKAVIASLKQYPYLNSSLDEEHEEILLKKYYNIGVAVDTEEGLIVPVIKGADEKSILSIAQEIEQLAEKARTRKIDLADLKGGTFTITNIGFIGGKYATPIINYPETAILATGRIHDKPIVQNGKIVIKKILPLSLAFDHRIIDGAMGARFLRTIIKYLEDPNLLLIECE
jgi:pyruvate dehydrogenase E2 component (dihydrolipoamide acetyltransferase)